MSRCAKCGCSLGGASGSGVSMASVQAPPGIIGSTGPSTQSLSNRGVRSVNNGNPQISSPYCQVNRQGQSIPTESSTNYPIGQGPPVVTATARTGELEPKRVTTYEATPHLPTRGTGVIGPVELNLGARNVTIEDDFTTQLSNNVAKSATKPSSENNEKNQGSQDSDSDIDSDLPNPKRKDKDLKKKKIELRKFGMPPSGKDKFKGSIKSQAPTGAIKHKEYDRYGWSATKDTATNQYSSQRKFNTPEATGFRRDTVTAGAAGVAQILSQPTTNPIVTTPQRYYPSSVGMFTAQQPKGSTRTNVPVGSSGNTRTNVSFGSSGYTQSGGTQALQGITHRPVWPQTLQGSTQGSGTPAMQGSTQTSKPQAQGATQPSNPQAQQGSTRPTWPQTLPGSCRYCWCATCKHSHPLCFVCKQPRKKCGESNEVNEHMGLPDLCRYCEFEKCTHCSSKCVICGKSRRRCEGTAAYLCSVM